MSASTERKNRIAAREAGTDKKLLARQEELAKQKKSRLRWTLAMIGIALLILAIIVTNSAAFYRMIPAVRVGDRTFSAAEVKFFAGNYNSYAQYYGADFANMMAENDMLRIATLNKYAEENGIELDADDLASVEAQISSLKESAEANGFKSVNRFLAAVFGKGVNEKVVREMMSASVLADKANQTLQDAQVYSEEQLAEAYAAFNGGKDLFDGAYFFVNADDGSSDLTNSMSIAAAQADSVISAYENGEGEDGVERFNAALTSVIPEAAGASVLSGTPGSSLPAAARDWYVDEARQAGDVMAIRSETDSEHGVYLVLFLNRDSNDYNTVSVRHILFKAEAAEDGSYSEEAVAAAQAKAEEALAQWQAGEATEESFAALANELSEDAGSNTKGGLYENIYRGQMVPEFDAFCFGGHQPGDVAIVHGDNGGYNGFHVIYFVGEGDSYRDVLARESLNNEFLGNWMAEQTKDLEVEHLGGYKLVSA